MIYIACRVFIVFSVWVSTRGNVSALPNSAAYLPFSIAHTAHLIAKLVTRTALTTHCSELSYTATTGLVLALSLKASPHAPLIPSTLAYSSFLSTLATHCQTESKAPCFSGHDITLYCRSGSLITQLTFQFASHPRTH